MIKVALIGIGYIGNAHPVSYTHLDVYKRQESGSEVIPELPVVIPIGRIMQNTILRIIVGVHMLLFLITSFISFLNIMRAFLI